MSKKRDGKGWRGFSQIKEARPASEDHLLMKYAKAHKETLGPLRKGGWWRVGFAGQEARQIRCVSKNEKQAKAPSISIRRDV